ncbi:leucine-rich repeat flightless-interacting protein 2 isoform X2 [Chrysoperla carnea]|uniref:leucine-rich repeat flightless-interacting protein 2 isoform X2 n=1 Tax=Chrysoperla carnea TaxID=189513 RepID=UPI001D06982D|nr:leucine-rich repeat flightless-interacting protein 2 isoform X2 [Chrysoperla carnea]
MVVPKHFVLAYRGWERHWRNRPSLSDCLLSPSDFEPSPHIAFNAVKSTWTRHAKFAEARLAAKRQARAEAREIRMRELERQQRELEENADRVYDMYTDPVTRTAATVRLTGSTRNTMLSNNSYMSSRRSSEDSLEDSGTLRDVRHELREIEEKFRKAMIANAQLDNDKASYTYQIELLKDKLEDLEQDHIQLQREHRDKCREHEQLKRAAAKLKEDLVFVKTQLEERDVLIAEKGLVIVVCEENGLNGYDDPDHNTSNGGNGDASENANVMKPKKALVSIENAELLESAGEGSLDVRLKRFIEEKKELEDQVRSLRIELDEERNKSRRRRPSSNTSSTIGSTITHNGPDSEYFSDLDVIDVQREANKQLADYKFKLQKAEQDIATLQGTVARLETQVVRYRAEAEASERAEDELKTEKRKLQREARESQNRVEELETANSHLQKRLDKLKNAKSTLLKEL